MRCRHILIAALLVSNSEVVMRFRIVGTYPSSLGVRFDRFTQPTRVVVGITKLVVNLWIVWFQLQRLLIRANRLRVFSLLHFAVTNLDPCLSASRIFVDRRFEISHGIVVVAQP